MVGGKDPPTGSVDATHYMNNTQLLGSVDDNDDKDRFPDWHMYSGIRDRNGIFPGLDKNGNNRPDTNENDNALPDYVEPFFLYYQDPDEYDYGDDYNNNGVIKMGKTRLIAKETAVKITHKGAASWRIDVNALCFLKVLHLPCPYRKYCFSNFMKLSRG